MAKKTSNGIVETLRVNSILGGQSLTNFLGAEDSYNSATGIDPRIISNSAVYGKVQGSITPVAYSKFSSTELDSEPIYIIRNDKDTNIYVYLWSGKILSYDIGGGFNSLIGNTNSVWAFGAAYYNNYIYFATGTDIYRYGPLNGTPTLSSNVWTGATLGSQAAMAGVYVFASNRQPWHVMHVHVDNSLYVADFLNGQGSVNRIKTKKTTYEGDTNNGSAAAALLLPFGYYPVAFASYGLDLAILAYKANEPACLFLWDTVSPSFYQEIFLSDVNATGIINVNGALYIFSGDYANVGCKISKFSGGDAVTELLVIGESYPPYQCMIDRLGDGICWCSGVTYPENTAIIYSYGLNDSTVYKNIHTIAKTSQSIIVGNQSPSFRASSLKLNGSSSISPDFILGSHYFDKGSNGMGLNYYYALEKKATINPSYTSFFRTKVFNIGRKFKINRIRIPLSSALSGSDSITVSVCIDGFINNFSNGKKITLPIINSTNNTNNYVVFKPTDLINCQGNNWFTLDFKWAATSVYSILYPIEIDVEIYQDEN